MRKQQENYWQGKNTRLLREYLRDLNPHLDPEVTPPKLGLMTSTVLVILAAVIIAAVVGGAIASVLG